MNRRSAGTTKVFVGSLPTGTTAEDLRALFAPYGPIVECDVVNRCGFLHLENKTLAFKAIDELNNFTFKGNRISVEKGRVKSNRDGGNRSSRNGYGESGGPGGPMRHNRDNFRPSPYARDNGIDFDRRGSHQHLSSNKTNNFNNNRDNYDRSFGRQIPSYARSINDIYGPIAERRSFPDDRRGVYDDQRYADSFVGIPNDNRIYPEERNMYLDDRRPLLADQRLSFDRRPHHNDRKTYNDRYNSNYRNAMNDHRPISVLNDRGLNERRPMLPDRRSVMDSQVPMNNDSGTGHSIPPQNTYTRRSQQEIYSRRPGKPIFGGVQGLRRDMPSVRRY